LEERIGTNLESGGPLLDSNRQSSLDIVFGAAVDSNDLQSEAASGRLPAFDIDFRRFRVARVHQQGDFLGRGNEFMQQFQPL
jgi:hypothetical protein